MDTEQLLRDKEELLRQVVSLQEEVEVSREEKEGLGGRVDALEKDRGEREVQCKALFEELKAAKATVQAKQGEQHGCSSQGNAVHLPPPPPVELKQLQDEVQVGW